MGSRIDHRAEFTEAVKDVFVAQSDADILRARLELLGGKSAALLEHTDNDDSVHFRLRQGIAAERLPQAVRSLHKGDLIVSREQTWEVTEDGYAGTARAAVDGVPGKIEARTALVREGSITALRTVGEVTVNIPLVGGKLEGVIAEQVGNLLDREAKFSADWLSGQH